VRIRRAGFGLVAVLLALKTTPLDAQRQTTKSLDEIDKWVNAVNAHVPGRPDAPVGAIIAMTYDARRDLNTAFSLFIKVLAEREVVITRSGFDRAVTRLARAVRLTKGSRTFLKRAALLHSDAVVFAHKFPPAPDDAPPRPPATETIAGRRTMIPVERQPPLLTSERVMLTRDGEVIGEAAANWNLPFARSLLDELLHRPERILTEEDCASDADCVIAKLPSVLAHKPRVLVPTPPVTADDREFVADWYHAIAAYLFASGMNGDARDHLQDAARVLPDDARLLFDRGSYAETFGLPIYQAVQDAASAKPNTFIARIPPEDKTNAEAERLYRRALEIDPAYLEARVRLARLLERRGQRDEAAGHIGQVLGARPSGVVGYYAFIVAGRIAAARRRYDEALQHYQTASQLYRGAQSALLGASQAALMLADVLQTLTPIEQLGVGTDFDADPWLDYQLGAGRDVNDLMRRVWARQSK
jgi:tetratricopeptide (TPR) repeat protein